MKKTIVFLYGAIAYLLGSSSLAYLIAFLFNLVPNMGFLHGIDEGAAVDPMLAVAINLALIALFGLQHTVMARRPFKQWLARHIPQAAERATYMLATAVVVYTVCLTWQPMSSVVWEAESSALHNVLLGVGLAGWVLVLYATFLINHFDLFGLRQVWHYFRGTECKPLPFKLNSLYRVIRHPIMTGAFIGIWFTPVMTVGHLLFAVGMSLYILVGVYFEERDLIHAFGERYRHYMQQTGRFLPSIWRSRAEQVTGNA